MKVADYLVENFWVITSIILAIIAIIYSIKSHKFQTSVAEQQGVRTYAVE